MVVIGGSETGAALVKHSNVRAVERVYPAFNVQTLAHGQTSSVSFTTPSPSCFINDISLKYKYRNKDASANVNIPYIGIWSHIELFKVRVNRSEYVEIAGKRVRLLALSNINKYATDKTYYVDTYGTNNTISETTLTNQLGALTLSSWYCSSLNEILGDLFRDRSCAFIQTLEIEITLISASGATSTDSKYIGLSTGLGLDDVDVENLQLQITYSHSSICYAQLQAAPY
jgi:dimeric dUTPase (all-alpha-NTP-PPase superfamily)